MVPKIQFLKDLPLKSLLSATLRDIGVISPLESANDLVVACVNLVIKELRAKIRETKDLEGDELVRAAVMSSTIIAAFEYGHKVRVTSPGCGNLWGLTVVPYVDRCWVPERQNPRPSEAWTGQRRG